ncbi:MAG: flagellar assembly peptidoglycan hydrolase FlgJ [Ectothiorhodospiraceae bacterium]|nr:flagellar assembly peptidoglycan hydrolase FlgJ [Ectothiorhodospiraceae bacterium]
MATVHSPNIFDTGNTVRLRRDLQNPSEDSLREVAKQFESLFVQMMLKNMRAATPGDSLFSSGQSDQYRDLYDQQLSMSLSQGQGFGIADMVERQLREQAGLENRGVQGGKSITDYDRRISPMRIHQMQPADASGIAEDAPAGEPRAVSVQPPGGKGSGWETPEDFIRDVWPAAKRTAERLGADPRALVAQAALETGWGQHVIRRADGSSSHNLFGIKATPAWDGDRVNVQTLEYRGGVPQREMAVFRAYDSLEQSFEDYLRFLNQNPRYAGALKVSHNPEAYTNELQRAGYATDPRYAEKIQSIMRGSRLTNTLAELKESPPVSTSI